MTQPTSVDASIKDLQKRVGELEAQLLQLNMVVRSLALRKSRGE